ncbi:hypothetical protein [Streptomyces africanus]|uniref:hypothetical protein n=1 Tax=Streptomyces africanus TaxID=231024 RepID=UPI000A37652F|nr:hypothetical protein [Streptomyces africanus]
MIPATGMEVAVIETEGGRKQRLPVQAWADDGHPMVVGDKGLVRADSCGHLSSLQCNGDGLYPVAAAVPGGGWFTRVEDTVRAITRIAPVVAWVMRTDGTVTAVTRDSNGDLVDIEGHQLVDCLYHPDETVTEHPKSVPTQGLSAVQGEA